MSNRDRDSLKQSPKSKENLENIHNYRSEPLISEPQDKALAVITLDIGDKTEIVKIFEGDDIRKKAREITQKHNLTEEAVDYLIENINDQIISNGNKPQGSHKFKNSADTSTDINLNNKSLAEIQYENWQKILQQKSKLKPDHIAEHATNSNFHKSPDNMIFKSNPQINTNHHNSNEIKDFDEKNVSIYEKLYHAAVQSQNKKKEKSRIYEEEMKRDKSESNFKPNINNFKSKQPKNNNTSVSPIRNAHEISDYLYNDGKKYMERKKKIEKIKEEMELEKCSFKPNINKTSQILSENKNTRTHYKTIHDKLYRGGIEEEQQKEQWRKAKFELYYPFQPNLGKEERNSCSVLKKENIEEFINRLVHSKQLNEQSNTNLRIKELYEIDKNTGQALFQPHITKDQYYYNVKSKENDEYEEFKKEAKQHLKEPKDVNDATNQKEKKQIVNENKEIKEDQMTKLLRNIFNLMDNDKDKWISSTHIDISEVDPYFLEIIQEILFEMEEKKQKIDFKIFIRRIKDYHLEKSIFEVIIQFYFY